MRFEKERGHDSSEMTLAQLMGVERVRSSSPPRSAVDRERSSRSDRVMEHVERPADGTLWSPQGQGSANMQLATEVIAALEMAEEPSVAFSEEDILAMW